MSKPSSDIEGSLDAGEIAPDFSLRNTDGKLFGLSASLAEKPLILVFYRGDW
jgi:peroxiredoxin